MVKSGESEREAAARSDELFKDGDIVAAGGKNHSEIRIKQKKSWVPVVFILPALAFLILFNYVPMYGILIAFQDYVPGDDFLSANTIWIGWQNFSMFFRRNEFLATDCKHFYFKHTRLYHRIPFANYRSAIIEFVYQ